jgi:hypothetical protein
LPSTVIKSQSRRNEKSSNCTITGSLGDNIMAASSSVIVIDDENVREIPRYKPNKAGQVDDTVRMRQEDVDQHVQVMLHLAN